MINELNLDLDTAKINIKVYFIQESVFCFFARTDYVVRK